MKSKSFSLIVFLVLVESVHAQTDGLLTHHKTPAGVEYSTWARTKVRPAPTLFILSSTAKETLGNRYYRQCGNQLAERGFVCVSVDLPCHGKQQRKSEPGGLAGWSARAAKQQDFVAESNARLSAVLDHLIKSGVSDPARIAVCGTSRGGFLAIHFAAHDKRVGCAAAFAPVTALQALREFHKIRDLPFVRTLALSKQVNRLAGRSIWIVIGDQDERVGTDRAIKLARELTKVSRAKKLTSQVVLQVQPEPRGHTTPVGSPESAAKWIYQQLVSKPSATATKPIDIGSRRELLVDHFLIDRLDRMRLTLHRPRPREVAMRFDRPWEGNTCGYPTVLRDGDKFIMIYRAHGMTWDGGKLRMEYSPLVCYAESRDGKRWTKPNLRRHRLLGGLAKGVKDPLNNNILYPGSSFSGNFSPFIDTRPGCPPAEKFKAVAGTYRTGLHLFTSANAIDWKKSKGAVFKRGVLDSHNVVFYEPRQKKYVLYYRTVVKRMRSISRATSLDLRNWSKSQPLQYPGSPRQQMYTNGIHPYHRAPHILIGFPTRYTARKITGNISSLEPVTLRKELAAAYARVGSDLSDGLLMTSRDGLRFRRWDEAFIRPGVEAGPSASRWMYGDNYQSYQLFETSSDRSGAPNELSILIREGYWRKNGGHLRRYTLRLDGFVSARAPFTGGELLTKPLRFKGSRLTINYSTSAAGSLRVELQDNKGRALPGFTIDDCVASIGDSVKHTVRWKHGTDVSALAGKSIRIRFVLRDADLYALQFLPATRPKN